MRTKCECGGTYASKQDGKWYYCECNKCRSTTDFYLSEKRAVNAWRNESLNIVDRSNEEIE